MKAVFAKYQHTRNKEEALEEARQTLSEFADYLIEYTWLARIKTALLDPKDLTPTQKEHLKTKIVEEKVAEFKKILDDA